MSLYAALTATQEDLDATMEENKIDDICKQIRELYGSWPGIINMASIQIQDGYIVISGNDGGLDEEDMQRLKHVLVRNGRGHGEWGLGSRRAAACMCKNTTETYFWITDGTRGIEYKLKNGNLRFCEKDQEFWKNIYTSKLPNHLDELIEKKNVTLENSKKIPTQITKWIVPCKTNEDSHEKIKQQIKRAWCKDIFLKSVNWYYNGERLSVNQPFLMDEYRTFKEYYGKTLYDGEEYGNAKTIYKLDNSFYQLTNNRLRCLSSSDIGDGEQLQLKNTYKFVPILVWHKKSNFDIRDKIAKEYGFDKITELHGAIFMDSNVFVHENIIGLPRHRMTGNTNGMQFVLAIERKCSKQENWEEDKDKKSVIRTKIQKADEPEIIDVVNNKHERNFSDLMTILIQKYKQEYKKKEKKVKVVVKPIVEDVSSGEEEYNKEKGEVQNYIKTLTNSNSTQNTIVPNRQRIRRVANEPGGWFYVYTLDSWGKPGQRVFRGGKVAEGSRHWMDRIKEHQREHPTESIKLVKLIKIPCNIRHEENVLFTKIQEAGIQFDTFATNRSEYFIDFQKFKEILDNTSRGTWIKDCDTTDWKKWLDRRKSCYVEEYAQV